MLISSSVFIANGLFDLDLSGGILVDMFLSGLSSRPASPMETAHYKQVFR
jgi:hypothetical protein